MLLYCDSLTRPVGLFQIPFSESSPLSVASKISLVSLPKCVISVSVTSRQAQSSLWKSMRDKFYL